MNQIEDMTFNEKPAATVRVVAPVSGIISKLQLIAKSKTKTIKRGEVLLVVNGQPVIARQSGNIVENLAYKVGDQVERGAHVMTFKICGHPAIFANMCVNCGERCSENENSSSSQDYGTTLAVGDGHTLKLSKQEVAAGANIKHQGLRQAKKLALVLDLDLTLIHCIMVPRDTPPMDDCHDFSLNDNSGLSSPFSRQNFRVKLRPHVEQFLQQAKEKFRMFVYTHGTRPYAEKITSILDPDGSLMSKRIVSRSDTTDIGKGIKSLSRIVGDSGEMTVIMDDNADVWRSEGIECLLHVKPFIYFQDRQHQWANMISSTPTSAGSADGGGGASPRSSAASDDQLLRCMDVLDQVHSTYYASETTIPGVKPHMPCSDILNDIRRRVLPGCVVAILDASKGHYAPIDSDKEEDIAKYTHELAQEGIMSRDMLNTRYTAAIYASTAISLGARVVPLPDASTTHIAVLGIQKESAPSDSEPITVTVRPSVSVVHADWIKYSLWALQRQTEERFHPRGGLRVAIDEAAAIEAEAVLREVAAEVAAAENTERTMRKRAREENASDGGDGEDAREPPGKKRDTAGDYGYEDDERDSNSNSSSDSDSGDEEAWLASIEDGL